MADIDSTFIQPVTERGVVVDTEGYFVAAWQWGPGDTPRLPRETKGSTPRFILLRKPAEALDPPGDQARWDFDRRIWELPSLRLWVVDDQGTKRSGGTYWPNRLPPLPPGWLYVDVPPPEGRAIWVKKAGEWSMPRRVYVGVSGVVEDIVLENPNDDTPNAYIPEGLERLGEGEAIDDVHGEPVGIGCVRNSEGKWRNTALDQISKGSYLAALSRSKLTDDFVKYIKDKDLEAEWKAATNAVMFSGYSRFITAFLVEHGLSSDDILTVLHDATGKKI